MMRLTPFFPFALIGALGLALQGCSTAGVVAGGAATVGVAAAQERTVGDAVDDSLISVRINSELLQTSEKLFRQVGTEVTEGRVLLTGKVQNPEDRITAERIAWSFQGVKEVLNEIQVTDKSSLVDAAKDSWITTKLRAQLLADFDVYDINYSIDTVNGVIYLFGIAQNRAELDQVIDKARNISGVRKVVSHVVLKGDTRRSVNRKGG